MTRSIVSDFYESTQGLNRYGRGYGLFFIVILFLLIINVCVGIPLFIVWYMFYHRGNHDPESAPPITEDDFDGW